MVDHKNAALKRIRPGMRQAMKYDQTLLIKIGPVTVSRPRLYAQTSPINERRVRGRLSTM